MGFRDLHAFNKALLGKQAWRVLKNPASLLSRLYKGRYHYSTTFLQSSNITQASYGWKSIQVGKELLLKGLRTLIANGSHTNVWSDNWIPTVPPRKLLYPTTCPDMMVSELISSDCSWNVPLIQKLFSAEDSLLVKSLKLSRYASQDQYIWPFTKNMEYSVKSGYWFATHYVLEDDNITPPTGSVVLKDHIWKLNIMPKIKHFVWKVLSRALATYGQLCTRGINLDPTCQRCCLDEETLNHALFRCPYAFATWRCSNIPISAQFTEVLEENITLLIQFARDCGEESNLQLLPFWVLWFVWKSRNEFLFNKRNVQPMVDANRAFQACQEWFIHVKFKHRRVPDSVRLSSWNPPPEGWLKCNFDCSFKSSNNYVGLGWILRDSEGCFMGAAQMKMARNEIKNAFQGEAYAFKFALQHIWINVSSRIWSL